MTKNSIAWNRSLFIEDNLPVLRGLDSENIDLIATDPPFNKGVGAFEGTTKAGVDVEFKDVWHWGDVHDDWIKEIEKGHPRLFNVIRYANDAAGDDMGAFLCWMSVRVLEMRRVLKPTGSMYLHCDPTASHYIKAMMDAVFGRGNFRNEIVWHYSNLSATKRYFPKKHDIILFYSKGRSWTFNADSVRVPYSQSSQDRVKYKGSGFASKAEGSWIHEKGKIPDTVWDIPLLKGKERTGYPTQKPLALYKRMIAASSNRGDMVLDPFAGCATTCVAAEQLGRQWIGIDIQEKAGPMMLERLNGEVSASMAWDDIVRTPTEAPERTDDGAATAAELILVSPKRRGRRLPVREVREHLLSRDGLRCQGCGWEPHHADYLQVDHKKPKSLKGSDDMDNLALLCDPCNRRKSNKLTIHKLREERETEGRIMDDGWYEEEKMLDGLVK